MKLLWSGNATTGAVITVPELPYYSVFALGRGGGVAFACRWPNEDTGVEYIYSGFTAGSASGTPWGITINLQVDDPINNPTKLRINAVRNSNYNEQLNRIWGIL